jgi:chemotaxis protein CheD
MIESSNDANTQLASILGSCVSVVLWQPERKLAIMNHVLLSRAGRSRRPLPRAADARYAQDSWNLMLAALGREGVQASECVGFLAGGARFTDQPGDIGQQNVDAMAQLLESAGVMLRRTDTGGRVSRAVRFDPATGAFTVRHVEVGGQSARALPGRLM